MNRLLREVRMAGDLRSRDAGITPDQLQKLSFVRGNNCNLSTASKALIYQSLCTIRIHNNQNLTIEV